MRDLIILNGTMGVGKTATSRELQKRLTGCVFLDGDWCWDAHPFVVTEETKDMVLHNIAYLLNNFLDCSAYKYVLFCWVLHEQAIIDALLSKLKPDSYRLHLFTLVCPDEALTARLSADVDAGIRQPDVIARSLLRQPAYRSLDSHKVDVGKVSPADAAQYILEHINKIS